MSKMSQLHAELSEQANELGYETLEEAQANGYAINYQESKLVKYECCDLVKEQEKAHEEWLKEQQIVLGDLMNLLIHKAFDFDIIERAYKFIKEQCHD